MKKYLPIIIASFIWIWPAILIKILSFYFDNYTQNFYRYLAGSFVLLIISLIFHRKELFNYLKEIKKFILPVILIFVHQIVFVAGIYMLTPTVAVLIGKSSVFFIILFSFIFFVDERRIIKSKSFIFGSLLAVVGVCGVIVGKGNLHLDSFNLGAALILITPFFTAIFSYIIFQEVLTLYQILSGVVLLMGCSILMSAGNRLLSNK